MMPDFDQLTQYVYAADDGTLVVADLKATAKMLGLWDGE